MTAALFLCVYLPSSRILIDMNLERFRSLLYVLTQKGWQTLLLAFVLYAGPILVFGAIADEVLEKEPIAFDTATLYAVRSLQSPQLDTTIPVLTDVGGVIGVAIISLILISIFYFKKRISDMVFYVSAVGGAAALNALIKLLFQRDRPELWQRLVTENGYSFPSGHAMASSAVAFTLVVLFWNTKYRWLVVVISAIYMIFVAFSRLYLGVHYPSDIIAGWAASGFWVAITSYVFIRHRRRSAV